MTPGLHDIGEKSWGSLFLTWWGLGEVKIVVQELALGVMVAIFVGELVKKYLERLQT